MSSERKEGIIISAIALGLLLLSPVFTDWDPRFSLLWNLQNVEVGPTWFAYKEYEKTLSLYIDHLVYPLKIKYIYIFTILCLVFVYGALRAFGVVKRIFRFESYLSRIIPPDETR